MATETRDIQKHVLPNGLVVLTETMSHVRSVSVGVWFRNGSRREVPEENGLAHFMEHMVFKGTERRSAEAIAREMDSVGGMLDAFTSKEQICFNAKIRFRRPEEGTPGGPRRNKNGFGQPRISPSRNFHSRFLAATFPGPPDSRHAGNGESL